MDIAISFIAVGPFTGNGLFLGGGLGGAPIKFDALYGIEVGCTGLNGIGAPITDVVARVTTRGRQMLALSLVDGSAFQITQMGLGTGGYDSSNPIMSVPIDPERTQLDNEIFRKDIDIVEVPNALSSRAFTARFDQDSFTGGVGEIGLWATILDFPSDPTQEGEQFLFAIAHQGLATKTLHSIVTYRVFITI